jgi:hypothetical protein
LQLPGIDVGVPATQLASSVMPVLAMMIAPASRRGAVKVASYSLDAFFVVASETGRPRRRCFARINPSIAPGSWIGVRAS